MNFLFVHQNFPGQYLHLVRYLAQQSAHRVVFITQRKEAALPRVDKRVYAPTRAVTPGIHHYLRDQEAAVLNAQAVARVAWDLKREGFVPDVMLGHNGWGEIWYLKDVFPHAPLLGYFEFFYQAHGADVDFDPSLPSSPDHAPRLRTRNSGNLLGLHAADFGQTPTHWQHSTYPHLYQPKIQVLHEGIESERAIPNAKAVFALPAQDKTAARTLTAGDEVLTYVARNLEPHRGFPSLMRSLPKILAARPQAQVLIVGGDEVSYGARLPEGQSYRQHLLAEVGDSLDLTRVHFLGRLPYLDYLRLLQVSRVHLYLTYPFVLSWSMLEAMSCGCLLIASRTAPVEEVMSDGQNGLLVDFFDTDNIAERVVEALAAPQQFTSLRQQARATILQHYDLHSRCLPQMLRWLAQIGNNLGFNYEVQR